jgi:hypothetical protein
MNQEGVFVSPRGLEGKMILCLDNMGAYCILHTTYCCITHYPGSERGGRVGGGAGCFAKRYEIRQLYNEPG